MTKSHALLMAVLAMAVGCERPPARPLPAPQPDVAAVEVKPKPEPVADVDSGPILKPKVPDPPIRTPGDDDWKSPAFQRIEDEASGKAAALRRLERDAFFHGTPPDELRKMREATEKEYAGKRK